METPNKTEKNDTNEAEYIKKGLRAEALFRYIEKKEKEYKQERYTLLKSIVAKQRQKIAYESERWDKKLKIKAFKKPKVIRPKKLETMAADHDSESISNDTMGNKNDEEYPLFSNSLKGSLKGSRNLSGYSSLVGSRNHLFEQSLRKPEVTTLRTIPILLEEQKELQTNLSTKPVFENTVTESAKPKKVIMRKSQHSVEESEAATKVFKTYDAFLDFQSKYSQPVEESEIFKTETDMKKSKIDGRMQQIKRLHDLAVKNRERIALYMSGESNYAMGVPIGFKVDPHAITDNIRIESQRIEEVDEKLNLRDELNMPATRPPLSVGKRASFFIGKGQPGPKSFDETDGNISDISALSLAQEKVENGRRPTNILHNGEHDENTSINDILQELAKNVDSEERSNCIGSNNDKKVDLSLEEADLLKSLAVMADDRLGLSSNFLQKSLSKTDSFIKRTSELNSSKSFSRTKTIIMADKEKRNVSLVKEDPQILQFSSHHGSSKSSSTQHLAAINTPKFWEHINLKSVEDFGSSMQTSQAKLDNALRVIPNSFDQLCLNIEKDSSRPKLGVFSASISSKNNTKMIQSDNSKFKIPKNIKYWKTSSSFDDDIPIFS